MRVRVRVGVRVRVRVRVRLKVRGGAGRTRSRPWGSSPCPRPPGISDTYGCSLHRLRLQPAPPTVAASTAYGCRLECPRPRLDAALQREPFVPCHGLGRLQAARHVRGQEGRLALGLDARAAELLSLGEARRRVEGGGDAALGPLALAQPCGRLRASGGTRSGSAGSAGQGGPPTSEGAPGRGAGGGGEG